MSNYHQYIRWGALGVLISCSALLASCDFDDDNNVQPVPVSYVAIYNAIPDAPELDVTVDSRLVIPRAYRFGDNTYYRNFYTGARKFQVTPYGANNVVIDTTVTLVDQNAYSVFMIDEYSKARLLVTNDSAAVSKEGVAKVRLINLSPDAAPVLLRKKDEVSTMTEHQPFTGVSSFVELDPGVYTFEIVSHGGESPLVVPDVDLRSGSVRTIVVRGYRTPPAGNSNVISAEVVVN